MALKNFRAPWALLAGGLMAALAVAAGADEWQARSNDAFAVAVYGDAPYGCKAGSTPAPDVCPPGYSPDMPNGPIPGDSRQLDATPAFIAAVNRDNSVDFVLHAGDIHSGSNFCTLAYDQRVFDLWTQFKRPLIYTPGDNEWTDCQKSKEGGGAKNSKGEYVDYAAGHPVANLALVRSIFFAQPGMSLGAHPRRVVSQAEAFDPMHPSDAEYVENVMWDKSRVMFVTMNIPGGSNNDDDLWNTAAFGATRSAPQIQEVANRTGADLRWLGAAFAQAKANGDKAVVIMEQADMWDLDGTALADGHIANYRPFIDEIAAQAKAFNGSVLLINGDSHKFRSDNPFIAGAPCVIEAGDGTIATQACPDDAFANQTYAAGDVPNFHRLVVHGSTFPLEYTRLWVRASTDNATTASSFGPFRWERVIP